MDLRLLGPVEVRLDDHPIELGPRKQRAVLAMLALHVGRTVSADHLVEGLRGDEPPSSAAKMVQLYVSHLRPLLAGSGARIVTRNGGYELQLPEGRWTRSASSACSKNPARAKHSPCGGATRWPTSPPSRSRRRRSGASTSCGCAPRRRRSISIWRRGATPR